MYWKRKSTLPPVPPNNGDDDDVIEVKRVPKEKQRDTLSKENAAGISGGIIKPTVTETYKDEKLAEVKITGEGASYTAETPTRWWQSLWPEQKKGGSKEPHLMLRSKQKTPDVSSPTEQPEQVFTSRYDFQRAKNEALRTDKPFHGKVGGASFQGNPTDPDFQEKIEAFNREIRQRN